MIKFDKIEQVTTATEIRLRGKKALVTVWPDRIKRKNVLPFFPRLGDFYGKIFS